MRNCREAVVVYIACTDYDAREPNVKIAINPAEIRNKYKFLSVVATQSYSVHFEKPICISL
jgi:hypothetical protein